MTSMLRMRVFFIVGYYPQRLLQDHRSYDDRLIQEIASVFGVSYEQLTEDYTRRKD